MSSDIVAESVTVPTTDNMLRGELAYPWDRAIAAALIAGPHPHMGGSMDNNLVAALAEALPHRGLATLRFDYSVRDTIDLAASMAQFWATGHAPEDDHLINEAIAAAHWLKNTARLPWFAVGYSFGALAAMRTLQEQPAGLVLIAPTLARHTFDTEALRDTPTLVIYSDDDFATPRHITEKWLDTHASHAERLCINGAEHFFIGVESEVVIAIDRFINKALKEAICLR